MFSPVPLRVLCTKSVMVPALAEATAQSRGRLHTSHPQATRGDTAAQSKQPGSAGSMNGPGNPHKPGGQESIVKSTNTPLTEHLLTKKLLTDSTGNKIYGVKILEPNKAKIMGANGTAKPANQHSATKLTVNSVPATQQANAKMVKRGQLIYKTQLGIAASTAASQNPIAGPSMSNGIGSLARKLQQPAPKIIKNVPTLNMVGLRLATASSINHVPVVSGNMNSRIHHTVSHTATTSKPQQTLILPLATTSSKQVKVESVTPKIVVDNSPSSEISKKQLELERRAERLVRRLRRLQSRQCVSHVQRELSAFVDHQGDVVCKITGKSRTAPKDVETHLLQNEDVKNLSTAALVNLVRKLQTTHAQALRQRLSNATQTADPTPVITLEQDSCYEMKRVAGVLTQSLHHVQETMDSDATESSSGGESCEEDSYEDRKPPSPALSSQARYQWAQNRASIISRWTWLQAQVSDLEYRIRQQNDIYRQIRTTKGPVLLGEHPGPEDLMAKSKLKTGRRLSPIEQKIANIERKNELSPCPISTLLNNTDKQSAKLIQSLGNVYSPASSVASSSTPTTSKESSPRTPNGLVDGARTNQSISEEAKPKIEPAVGDSPSVEDTCQAARCRPVKTYRKRKLFRTAGLYQVNRKAARLSTVKCHCYPPEMPCPMCGGRYNNKQPIQAETMPTAERVALLDHSYHQVLSFDQGVSLKIHFEDLLHAGDLHTKGNSKSTRLAETGTKRKYNSTTTEPKRKYTRRVNKSASAAVLSSTRIKNKYEQKQLTRGGTPGTPKRENKRRYADIKMRKRKAERAIASLKKHKRAMSEGEGSSPTMKDFPLNCPKSFQDMKEALKKRRGESAYDINNIVIPYSMAAATRVEKLQYKEIITPRWRSVDHMVEALALDEAKSETKLCDLETEAVTVNRVNKTVCDRPNAEEEFEDLSDEVFEERHSRCEMAEKKRFLTFAQIHKRGRPGRSDSVGTLSQLDQSENTSSLSHFGRSESASVLSQFDSNTHSATGLMRNLSTPVLPDLNGDTEIKIEADLDSETSSVKNEPCQKVEDIIPRSRSSSVTKIRSRGSSASLESHRTFSETNIPYTYRYVAPWQTRIFPLTEDEFHLMRLGMELPSGILSPSRSARRNIPIDIGDPGSGSSTLTVESGQGTPISSEDEIIEDPDDPEWTVLSPATRLQKTGLVLKLSRR